MEVADSIVVIAGGRIEQTGSPSELYEEPANDFVMSFLGPVTKLGDRLVRPHDLDLRKEPDASTVEATVVRVLRLGFEVRVEVVVDGVDVWVQLTREQVDGLSLAPGSVVHVGPARRTPEPSVVPATTAGQ